MAANDTPPSSVFFRFKIELIFLVILTALTIVQFFFKETFLSLVEPLINKLMFMIAASVGATLPGLIYRTGEWYTRVIKGENTRVRERAFFVFLIETGLAVLLAITLQRLLLTLFPEFIKYIWLILLEWFLIVYLWFTRIKKYSFPWFYVIATNVIIILFGFITYRYV